MYEMDVKTVDPIDGETTILSIKSEDHNQHIVEECSTAFVANYGCGASQSISADVCYIKAGTGTVQNVNGVRRTITEKESDKWYVVVKDGSTFTLCNCPELSYIKKTIEDMFDYDKDISFDMDGVNESSVHLFLGDKKSKQMCRNGNDVVIAAVGEDSTQVLYGEVCYIKAGTRSIQYVNGLRRIVTLEEADKWYVVFDNGYELCDESRLSYIRSTIKDFFECGINIANL